ncbi:Peptide deformylase [Methylophaga lonarensis MPL]|uniref:Peptide deformylase n=1 Tax=Methylophaga lonarensis MPL TaxID=1286106 RepID=M7PJZ8_9GAMM|nr:peptide deformylase [Methylophaga lonarensis]EMR14215.1 Peptide deformylase [Methylophaga lonarensis MPL]
MALMNILHFPDPRLRNIAQPVDEVNDDIRQLAADMLETMYAAPGIGLAAIQVNVEKRVIVIDISEDQSQPLTLINPEIVAAEGEREYQEGCLSVPEAYEVVSRADTIRVKALDLQGEVQEFEAEGLLATCIQHEIDHLDGKLFVDYLSNLKRQRIKKRLEKHQKQKL